MEGSWFMSSKKPVVFARPRDRTLEAYREWVIKVGIALTGKTEEEFDTLTPEQWRKAWEEFWEEDEET